MERDLSKDEFQRFHDRIYELSGIHYPPEKIGLLSNQIRNRIVAIDNSSYGDYLDRIGSRDQAAELQAFLDSIISNETHFFRGQLHWDHFRGWLERKKANPDTMRFGLRLWSAAAANGAEACTMLIILHQVFGDDFGGVPVEVLGTDLSTSILEEARQATFTADAVAQTPPEVIERYFTQSDDKLLFAFDRKLLTNARFTQHNLMDRLPELEQFDAVFVRNVLIDFDRASRKTALEHAYHSMCSGGLLFIGESESLLGVKHPFQFLKSSIFTKQASSLTKQASSFAKPATGAPNRAPEFTE